MIIQLYKFGELLISRPAGHEAYLSTKAYLLKGRIDQIIFDFEKVKVLAPSWISEFIGLLKKDYPDLKIEFLKSDNPSIVSSLKIINPDLK